MNFLPKQHLEIANYVKYIDEILHKCDKGIEYCKICPNEFVCTELEKDDFGLKGSTISDVLTAIQNALNNIPGYLNPAKKNELREHIQSYINESPAQERTIWEDSVLDILLDDKLANVSYKPKAERDKIRTLLTYNSKIGFSTYTRCFSTDNTVFLQDTTIFLPHDITSNSTQIVNRYVRDKHPDVTFPQKTTHIKFCLEKGTPEIIQGCRLIDTGLASALCFYAVITKSFIRENIAVTGGLDSNGKTIPADNLDCKIETVLRELHFIDKIVIPKGNPYTITLPENLTLVEVGDLGQAIDVIFQN